MRVATVLVATLAVATACSDDASYSDIRPSIERLPFSLAPYDAMTMRAGALDFRDEASRDKILLEFAGTLIDATTPPGGSVSPRIEVRLRSTALVYAPADGLLTGYERDATSVAPIDYSLRFRAAGDSRWEIGLSHVAAEGLIVGMAIRAGDVLGTGVREKNLELEIYDLADDARRSCPLLFMGDARPTVEAELTQLFADWEAFKADPAIYDEAGMFAPGCAQGRYPP